MKTDKEIETGEQVRRLANIAVKLPMSARENLLEYAEFLAGRHATPSPGLVPEPKRMVRPEQESVIAAMGRLAEQYYMLERDDLLSKATELMSQHVLQGRAAADVIDDLELLFKEHYAALKAQEMVAQ